MDPQQQFCLKWNSFGSNLVSTFDSLFKSSSLTDVTLFCEGVTFQAHKLILAACSKHFQDLFESAPLSPSILVILDGTSSSNMSALLEFMYKGEVHVAQESLSSFLKAAEYLQVKGLTIEHEKLVTQPASGNMAIVDTRLESPSRASKYGSRQQLNTSGGGLQGMQQSKMDEGPSSRCSSVMENEMLPPSSTPSYTASSPYHLPNYKASMYEQRPSPIPHNVPPSYDMFPRKRVHRSPTDQLREPMMRDTVLKNGPKRERESPMSVGYTPPPPTHHYEALPPPQSSSVIHSESSPGSFDQTAALDKSPSPHSWPSNEICATDLRIKSESGNVVGGNREPDENTIVERKHFSVIERKYYSSFECTPSERIPPFPPLELLVSSSPAGNSASQLTPHWNPSLPPIKIDPHHKGVTTTTAPDGKKLRCPYCERLYGYETNLRAHIRQRHQGIRVHCPFCTRTFTRNNTVRRHMAREHKTELGLNHLNSPPNLPGRNNRLQLRSSSDLSSQQPQVQEQPQ